MPEKHHSAGPLLTPDWERLATLPRFRSLIREKRRFIIPATIFFIAYYLALPILVGYFPELMKRRVLGPLNLAYLFALSQFGMAWTLAGLYLHFAARFDKMAADVLRSPERTSE